MTGPAGASSAGITREARFYAVKELARRAGVTAEFFRSWNIDFRDQETVLYVQPGTAKRIQFRNAPASFWRDISSGVFRTARASWMHPTPNIASRWVPDLVVPFSDEKLDGERPLFSPVDGECVECPFDLPLSVLFSLSRWEETVSSQFDQHGRFASSMSIAVRDGFISRPIVDECGLALEQAVTYLLPNWRANERKLRVKLSHDIDEVGIPFNPKAALGHIIRRRKPLATARDLVSWVSSLNPAYLEAVRKIAEISLSRGLDSAVYWKASPRSRWDSGYDPNHSKGRRMIAWLRDQGVENGVHPGYETFLSPERLNQEVRALRKVLGAERLGGRQHYLRWRPDSWLHWEDCGLAYDSSVGYADHVGFRAGTCMPYQPWLFSLNREARLIEVPLIVMETTLTQYMRLTRLQSLAAVQECLGRCRAVGGVFTLLWHNNSLLNPALDGLYEKILDWCDPHEKFDWRTPSRELY